MAGVTQEHKRSTQNWGLCSVMDIIGDTAHCDTGSKKEYQVSATWNVIVVWLTG